ncbi:hypothetical protein OVA14_00210 [Agrococcus sp. SL85]|uniref:hypothetical protein n=1 Tax=Agrococcus sp. SL85 TaxID=2995141 RepID=UPI00226C6A6E|nr:hypothetical protein [Agrococcus sp. SL85]WAC67557.1 hypothetical protein OVA14_00210 [Agrococcus sp. SL85]
MSRKGTPSRRSSFSSDSRPKTRAAPPVACASAIQARWPAPGPVSSKVGWTFVARVVRCVGDVRGARPVELPFEEPLPEAPPRGGFVLVAMRTP